MKADEWRDIDDGLPKTADGKPNDDSSTPKEQLDGPTQEPADGYAGSERDPVLPSLGTLLDTIVGLLTRYIVFKSTAQATVIALWIAHTHALDAFDVTPYLHLRSAEKRSGKTLLLEVIHELVPRPWLTIQPSEAVLFRKIEKVQPTLLLDEVDALFKGPSSDRTEGQRALLNAGYRRGATVDRCVGKDKDKIAAFKVFCAKALGGIGALPGTVGDRSISIVMHRRKKGSEPVTRFRPRIYGSEAKPLREHLTAWAHVAIAGLKESRPEVPDLGNDRAEEVWEPLIAIADGAGGAWPKQARDAARELIGAEPDTESIGVQLLNAIFEVFASQSPDSKPPIEQITTIDLLAALVERESEPWGAWWGRDIQQGNTRGPAAKLARLLKPFDIQPGDIREGREVLKGYKRAAFTDAWDRYTRPGMPPDEAPDDPEIAESPQEEGKGRDNATTVAAQGFEASRPASGENHDATAETLGAQGLSRCRDLDPEGRKNNGCRPTVFDLAEAAAFPSLEIRQGMRVLAGREAWVKFLARAISNDVEAARRALERGVSIP
jgi:hypothetical protein